MKLFLVGHLLSFFYLCLYKYIINNSLVELILQNIYNKKVAHIADI